MAPVQESICLRRLGLFSCQYQVLRKIRTSISEAKNGNKLDNSSIIRPPVVQPFLCVCFFFEKILLLVAQRLPYLLTNCMGSLRSPNSIQGLYFCSWILKFVVAGTKRLPYLSKLHSPENIKPPLRLPSISGESHIIARPFLSHYVSK